MAIPQMTQGRAITSAPISPGAAQAAKIAMLIKVPATFESVKPLVDKACKAQAAVFQAMDALGKASSASSAAKASVSSLSVSVDELLKVVAEAKASESAALKSLQQHAKTAPQGGCQLTQGAAWADLYTPATKVSVKTAFSLAQVTQEAAKLGGKSVFCYSWTALSQRATSKAGLADLVGADLAATLFDAGLVGQGVQGGDFNVASVVKSASVPPFSTGGNFNQASLVGYVVPWLKQVGARLFAAKALLIEQGKLASAKQTADALGKQASQAAEAVKAAESAAQQAEKARDAALAQSPDLEDAAAKYAADIACPLALAAARGEIRGQNESARAELIKQAKQDADDADAALRKADQAAAAGDEAAAKQSRDYAAQKRADSIRKLGRATAISKDSDDKEAARETLLEGVAQRVTSDPEAAALAGAEKVAELEAQAADLKAKSAAKQAQKTEIVLVAGRVSDMAGRFPDDYGNPLGPEPKDTATAANEIVDELTEAKVGFPWLLLLAGAAAALAG